MKVFWYTTVMQDLYYQPYCGMTPYLDPMEPSTLWNLSTQIRVCNPEEVGSAALILNMIWFRV